MFFRQLLSRIDSLLRPNNVLVIYGSRQVGKTTLVNQYLDGYQKKYFKGSGDDLDLKRMLESQSIEKISNLFSGYQLVVIDEAQKINQVGLALKIMVDNIPKIKIIATGSSSFDLFKKIGEPLTGRKTTLVLYPISVVELNKQFGAIAVEKKLEDLLIFGSYPQVLKFNYRQKKDYLLELRDSYLIKDILELGSLKYSRKIFDLLSLIAYQIGNEVSLNELANSLEISKQTVSNYLYFLEKAFIIINVRGFSRNLRKEVYKTSRYYFYDNGVRNAIINNFNHLKSRNDIGQLWENFLFIERLKRNHYKKISANYYFWRTYDKKEIDLIEEREGRLYGFEFKYGKEKIKAPKDWLLTYKNSSFKVINKDNYLEFLI